MTDDEHRLPVPDLSDADHAALLAGGRRGGKTWLTWWGAVGPVLSTWTDSQVDRLLGDIFAGRDRRWHRAELRRKARARKARRGWR